MGNTATAVGAQGAGRRQSRRALRPAIRRRRQGAGRAHRSRWCNRTVSSRMRSTRSSRRRTTPPSNWRPPARRRCRRRRWGAGCGQDQADAMVGAMKTIRPKLQDFYASLSDEQKAKFNIMGPGQNASSDARREQLRTKKWTTSPLIPAKAGVQILSFWPHSHNWVPAFAGTSGASASRSAFRQHAVDDLAQRPRGRGRIGRERQRRDDGDAVGAGRDHGGRRWRHRCRRCRRSGGSARGAARRRRCATILPGPIGGFFCSFESVA